MKKPKQMTSRQFKAALDTIGLLQNDAGALLGVTPRTISRWIAGTQVVPRAVSLLLGLLIDGHVGLGDLRKR